MKYVIFIKEMISHNSKGRRNKSLRRIKVILLREVVSYVIYLMEVVLNVIFFKEILSHKSQGGIIICHLSQGGSINCHLYQGDTKSYIIGRLYCMSSISRR